MPKRNKISPEETAKIEAARHRNKDKMVERWLKILLLHAAGESRKSIATAMGVSPQYITELVGEYKRVGLDSFAKKNYKGNRRNMSFAEEEALIKTFDALAEAGEIVETSAIKAAYVEKVGHQIGASQIYRVL
jgi:transposase